MRKESETTPLWPDGFKIPARRPLSSDAVADVCVVGAGISGLSVAYRLAREGVKVVVLEAGRIGGGETERTTAHLAVALDHGWGELIRVHGEELARLAAASHAAAIDEIESIAGAEGIECGFERLDGWLFADPGDPDGLLAAEHEASRQAGILGAELEPSAPLPSFTTGPAIRYPGQAQFHPLRYLAGLAAAVERLGGRIHCGTRVTRVEGERRPTRERRADGRSARAASSSPRTPRSTTGS
ncbi:MAG: FAD-binding oxidoreductase [Elusimicrobiota bacterium]|nr:MAG: FAD-binding oxidoreductase [Elusimicrobiota bacterium]